MRAAGRLVDHHRHHQARVTDRRQTDEGSDVLPYILPALDLVRRAGLAAHAVTRHARLGRRSFRLHRHFQHDPDLARGLWRKHLHATRRRLVGADQGQRPGLAITRKDRVGTRQLDQADRYAMPVGHRRLLDRPPVLPGPQATMHLAGEAEVGGLTEADTVEHLPHFLGLETECNLGGADVG